MAYTYQLKDAQNSVAIRRAANLAPTSAEFIELVNEAQRRISRRGDWYGMVQTAVLVFQGCSITWPRYISTIIACRTKRNRDVRPQNMWYAFTGPCRYAHNWHGDMVLEDAGQVCTYNDITGGGDGQYIRWYVEKQADVGKTLTLYGKAYGNQPLMQKDANGNWQMGLTLTAAMPYVSTSLKLIQIDSIVKDATQGLSRLYEYDATSNTQRDLALFEPNETNPTYRRSIIHNVDRWKHPDDGTVRYHQCEVLAKLNFIPASNPLDFLLLDNFDALKLAIQAIKAEDANDNNTAETLWLKAIREMNFEDRDKLDDPTIPVMVDATMCHVLRNPC